MIFEKIEQHGLASIVMVALSPKTAGRLRLTGSDLQIIWLSNFGLCANLPNAVTPNSS
jgi:hypothetical protein